MTFQKYNKYLVLKQADIEKYLTQYQQDGLDISCQIIAQKRKLDNKKVHQYVVVSEDQPYTPLVWKLIEAGETLSKEDLDKLIASISVER